MSNYNCFICQSFINDNIFKAYDKNLCSNSCRECLLNKFNFNNYYQLEEKKSIKKSNSYEKINNFSSSYYNSNIKLYEKNKSYPYLEIKNEYTNSFDIFNKTKITSFNEINKPFIHNKSNKRYCLNIYTFNLQDITFKKIILNLVKKTKKILIE